MNRQQAVDVERRRINGLPVTQQEMDSSRRLLNRDPAHMTPKFRPPPLSRQVQERVDAILCFNLGRALGSKA